MNLLYCGDKNVERGMYLSLMSILKHTDEKLNVYILTANVNSHKAIDENFQKVLTQKLKQKNIKSCVTLLDISYLFCSYLPKANMNTRFTPLCMLRLFADKVKEIPDKILYLDADVMCTNDFSDLYNTDMGDTEIVGVPDRYGKWFFGNILKHDYLNSGVLLLNMKQIRKSGLFEKCRKMCKEKKMFMPDQSALNKLATKRKASRSYNEQGSIKTKTVFKHFTTYFEFIPYFKAVTIKPWDEEKLHSKLGIYEFDDILDDYKKELLK